MLVRPMRRMTANMVAFRADPENPAAHHGAPPSAATRSAPPSANSPPCRLDLADCCSRRSHLAALGLAVSKINHDLRNLLASAQLFSERLAKISDPHVQRFAPKLMLALERAIAFCQSTLSYGRVQEPPPDRRHHSARAAGRGRARDLGLDSDARVRWVTAIERGLTVDADPRSAVPHPAQSRAQRAAGTGGARRPRTPAAIRFASPAGVRARWW